MRRVVVVTGGSAGIGRATVREFARAGADVAILARGPERLANAVREVEAAGGRALAIPVDVADGEPCASIEADLNRVPSVVCQVGDRTPRSCRAPREGGSPIRDSVGVERAAARRQVMSIGGRDDVLLELEPLNLRKKMQQTK